MTIPSLSRRRSARALSALIGVLVLFATLAAGSTLVAAGQEKWGNPAWTGAHAGVAVAGFLRGANQKAVQTPANPYPDVLPPARTLNNAFLAKHVRLFAWLAAAGETFLPPALLFLLCVTFRGARWLALILAMLAASLNFLYLFEGSSGMNPPLLVLWLTVVWLLATLPKAARWYALDLRQVVRAEPSERPGTVAGSAGRWVVVAIACAGVALCAVLLHPPLTALILLAISVALAVGLQAMKQTVLRPGRAGARQVQRGEKAPARS